MKKKSMSITTLLLGIFLITIIGLLLIRSINQSTKPYEEQLKRAKEIELEQDLLKQEKQARLFEAGTDRFIVEKAKENGFQHKEDIRYVITNKELLYDDPQLYEEGEP